jgi:hypothetical protein
MPKAKTLPPGLIDAIANAKRLTRELQQLQHDCELALTTGTDANLEMMRERASMIRSQSWAVQDLVRKINDSIDELIEAKKAAESTGRRPILTLSNGGR